MRVERHIILVVYTIALLCSIPLVLGEIKFENIEESYLLGQTFEPEITVTAEKNLRDFFDVELVCDDNTIPFYRSPINLNTSQSRKFTFESLTIFERMLGECELAAQILDIENNVIESTSDRFDVNNQLDITYSLSKAILNPGEPLIFSGEVLSPAFTKGTLKSDLFDSKTITAKSFTITIAIDDDEKPGTIFFDFELVDEHGNYAVGESSITINQVPTQLVLSSRHSQYIPDSDIAFSASIFDQTQTLMDEQITARVTGPNLQKNLTITSGSTGYVRLGQYQPPGEYTILVKSNKLQNNTIVSVIEVKNITTKIQNEVLIIQNFGNTKYEDEIKFQFTKGTDTYLVSEFISLKPGESTQITYQSKIPGGEYTIYARDFSDKPIGTSSIADERSFLTKLAQGLATTTGHVEYEGEQRIIDSDATGPKIIAWLIIAILVCTIAIILTLRLWRKYLKNNIGDHVNSQVKTKVDTQVAADVDKNNKRHERQKIALNTTITKMKQEKRQLHKVLTQHIDPAVVKELIAHHDTDYQGEQRIITILFLDMRGFTDLSEKTDSEEVKNLLNMFFTKTVDIVKRNNGVVNKFIGDAMMVLYNAPEQHNFHELGAARTAIFIQKEVAKLNERLTSKGKEPISVGIGIHTGEAFVGTVGANQRLEYTVIGNTVNLASRLQVAAPGGKIYISTEIHEKVSRYLHTKSIGQKRFKNVTSAIDVYEVLY